MGNKTVFWKDCWCDVIPLKKKFPNVYVIDVNKDCLVSDRIILGADLVPHFLGDWSKSIRRGRETRQLDGILNLVVNYNLSGVDDKWRRLGDSSGEFSAKSLRTIITDRVEANIDYDFSWISWVSLKVNCFVWRLLKNKIPLMVNLSRRGIHVSSSTCCFYNQKDEDIDHMFFSCEYAAVVWNWLSSWASFLPSVPNNLSEFESMLKAPVPVRIWRSLEVHCCIRLSHYFGRREIGGCLANMGFPP